MQTPISSSKLISAAHTPSVWRRAARCLLIVGIIQLSASQAAGQNLQAERVYNWDFQLANDANFDQRPDGWKRRQDRRHPAYIEMRIQPRQPEAARVAFEAQSTLTRLVRSWKAGQLRPAYVTETIDPEIARFMDHTILNNCLEIVMDGGGAELVSPRFPMESRFSYSLRGEMSCQALDGHTAWIELQLLDANEQVLEVLSTQPLAGSQDWQAVTTGISTSTKAKLAWGRVHLRVAPHDAMVLAGTAWFDSINVYRMPRLALKTDLPYYIARPGQPLVVQCEAMGYSNIDASLLFELRDALGRKLKQTAVPLRAQPTSTPFEVDTPVEAPTAGSPLDGSQINRGHATTGKRPYYVTHRATRSAFDGRADWELTIDDPGLYRVRVNLGRGGESSNQQREILIGVIASEDASLSGGPFGWSLPSFGPRLQPDEVPELVSRFGAGWIKMPIWFDPGDAEMAEKLVGLAERLQNQGTQCVGRLDQPPDSQRADFSDGGERLYAINLFRDPTQWEPVLEPVLTRMGMKLTWFQLGADDDTSFMGNTETESLLSNLRGRIQIYSQELRLAIPWTWVDMQPDAIAPPWNALLFSASPQLSAAELEQYVASSPTSSDVWVSIDPLDGERYRLLDRIRDLTQRMIAVKRSRASAAFVNDPLRPELRLFTSQKTIGEMLIPWRTLVSTLGSRDYAGSIELPNGSDNHIFQFSSEGLSDPAGSPTAGATTGGVMVLWNDTGANQQVLEQIYLGDEVQASDIWGRPVEVATATSERGTTEQVFPVGPWPLFVHNIDMNLVRFRQSFEVVADSLAGVSGLTEYIPLKLENTLPQTAVGKLTVVGPTLLMNGRAEMPLQLRTEVNIQRELPIVLRNDASAGKHNLRFDIDVVADKPYHFSLYRSIALGTGDIELVWETNRVDANTLELRIEVRNNTSATLDFDCKLFPPGNRYERFRIEEAKPGISLRELQLRVPDYAEDQEAWLRCEVLGSGRILNYRIPL